MPESYIISMETVQFSFGNKNLFDMPYVSWEFSYVMGIGIGDMASFSDEYLIWVSSIFKYVC